MAASDVLYAAPVESFSSSLSPKETLVSDPLGFEAPLDFSLLKDVHRGEKKSFIIHIQDAHSNLSGQQNLAGALDELMKRYDVSLVLVEGGTRDDSLTPLKKLASPEVWKRVAKKFLLEGTISGEEYLNLTSERPMKIMGIEDKPLYWESLRAYDRLAAKREEVLLQSKKLRNALEKLKNKLYPQELREYEKLSADASGQSGADFEEKFERLASLAGKNEKTALILKSFPNIQALFEIKTKEKGIDFNAANLEQAALLEALSRKGGDRDVRAALSKLSSLKSSRLSQLSFVEALLRTAREHSVSLEAYPDLPRYEKYLQSFLAVDFEALFDELERLEDETYRALLPDEDARTLRAIDRYAGLLDRAYRIQMSTKEFELFKVNEPDFATAAYLAFVNRKLADFGYFDDLLPMRSVFDEAKAALEDFYASVSRRDEAFMRNTERVLSEEKQQVAVLIAGGYHTSNLKKLFGGKEYSYAVLAPIVTSETNQRKYENILLAPIRKKEISVESVRGESRSGDKSLSALEEDLQNLKRKTDGIRAEATLESGARLAEVLHEVSPDGGAATAEMALELLRPAGARLAKGDAPGETISLGEWFLNHGREFGDNRIFRNLSGGKPADYTNLREDKFIVTVNGAVIDKSGKALWDHTIRKTDRVSLKPRNFGIDAPAPAEKKTVLPGFGYARGTPAGLLIEALGLEHANVLSAKEVRVKAARQNLLVSMLEKAKGKERPESTLHVYRITVPPGDQEKGFAKGLQLLPQELRDGSMKRGGRFYGEFELIFNEDKELVAALPAYPEGYRDEANLFFFSPFNIPTGALRAFAHPDGRAAAKFVLRQKAQRILSDRRALEAYLAVSGIKNPAADFPPFTLSRVEAGSGRVRSRFVRPEEFLNPNFDMEFPMDYLSEDAAVFLIPTFPTVYSPAFSSNTDDAFYRKVFTELDPAGLDSPDILDAGTGSGILMALVWAKAKQAGLQDELHFHAYDVNPLAVVNARMLMEDILGADPANLDIRLTDSPQDFGEKSFGYITANSSNYPPTTMEDTRPLSLKNVWDGTRSGKIYAENLKKMLPSRLSPDGKVVLWYRKVPENPFVPQIYGTDGLRVEQIDGPAAEGPQVFRMTRAGARLSVKQKMSAEDLEKVRTVAIRLFHDDLGPPLSRDLARLRSPKGILDYLLKELTARYSIQRAEFVEKTGKKNVPDESAVRKTLREAIGEEAAPSDDWGLFPTVNRLIPLGDAYSLAMHGIQMFWTDADKRAVGRISLAYRNAIEHVKAQKKDEDEKIRALQARLREAIKMLRKYVFWSDKDLAYGYFMLIRMSEPEDLSWAGPLVLRRLHELDQAVLLDVIPRAFKDKLDQWRKSHDGTDLIQELDRDLDQKADQPFDPDIEPGLSVPYDLEFALKLRKEIVWELKHTTGGTLPVILEDVEPVVELSKRLFPDMADTVAEEMTREFTPLSAATHAAKWAVERYEAAYAETAPEYRQGLPPTLWPQVGIFFGVDRNHDNVNGATHALQGTYRVLTAFLAQLTLIKTNGDQDAFNKLLVQYLNFRGVRSQEDISEVMENTGDVIARIEGTVKGSGSDRAAAYLTALILTEDADKEEVAAIIEPKILSLGKEALEPLEWLTRQQDAHDARLAKAWQETIRRSGARLAETKYLLAEDFIKNTDLDALADFAYSDQPDKEQKMQRVEVFRKAAYDFYLGGPSFRMGWPDYESRTELYANALRLAAVLLEWKQDPELLRAAFYYPAHQFFLNRKEFKSLGLPDWMIKMYERADWTMFLATKGDFYPDHRSLPDYINFNLKMADIPGKKHGDTDGWYFFSALAAVNFIAGAEQKILIEKGSITGTEPWFKELSDVYVTAADCLLFDDIASTLLSRLYRVHAPEMFGAILVDKIEEVGTAADLKKAKELMNPPIVRGTPRYDLSNKLLARLSRDVDRAARERMRPLKEKLEAKLRAAGIFADIEFRVKSDATVFEKVALLSGNKYDKVSELPDLTGMIVVVHGDQSRIGAAIELIEEWAEAEKNIVPSYGSSIDFKKGESEAHIDLRWNPYHEKTGTTALELIVMTAGRYNDYRAGKDIALDPRTRIIAHPLYRWERRNKIFRTNKATIYLRPLDLIAPFQAPDSYHSANLHLAQTSNADRRFTPVLLVDRKSRNAEVKYRKMIETSENATIADLLILLDASPEDVFFSDTWKSMAQRKTDLTKPLSGLPKGVVLYAVKQSMKRDLNRWLPKQNGFSEHDLQMAVTSFRFRMTKSRQAAGKNAPKSAGPKQKTELLKSPINVRKQLMNGDGIFVPGESQTMQVGQFEADLARFAADKGFDSYDELFMAMEEDSFEVHKARFLTEFTEYLNTNGQRLPSMGRFASGARLAGVRDSIESMVEKFLKEMPSSGRMREDFWAGRGNFWKDIIDPETEEPMSIEAAGRYARAYTDGWNKIQKVALDKRFDAADTRFVMRAYILAFVAHEIFPLKPSAQYRRLGGLKIPYIIHPVGAACDLVYEFERFFKALDVDAVTVAFALLHDTLEDTHLGDLDDGQLARLMDIRRPEQLVLWRMVRYISKIPGDTKETQSKRMIFSIEDQPDKAMFLTRYMQILVFKLAENLNTARLDLQLVVQNPRVLIPANAEELISYMNTRELFVKYFVNFLYRMDIDELRAVSMHWMRNLLETQRTLEDIIRGKLGDPFVDDSAPRQLPTYVWRHSDDPSVWTSAGYRGQTEFRVLEYSDLEKEVRAAAKNKKTADRLLGKYFNSWWSVVRSSFPPFWRRDWLKTPWHTKKLIQSGEMPMRAVVVMARNGDNKFSRVEGGALMDPETGTLLALGGRGVAHVLFEYLRDSLGRDTVIRGATLPMDENARPDAEGNIQFTPAELEQIFHVTPTLRLSDRPSTGARLASLFSPNSEAMARSSVGALYMAAMGIDDAMVLETEKLKPTSQVWDEVKKIVETDFFPSRTIYSDLLHVPATHPLALYFGVSEEEKTRGYSEYYALYDSERRPVAIIPAYPQGYQGPGKMMYLAPFNVSLKLLGDFKNKESRKKLAGQIKRLKSKAMQDINAFFVMKGIDPTLSEPLFSDYVLFRADANSHSVSVHGVTAEMWERTESLTAWPNPSDIAHLLPNLPGSRLLEPGGELPQTRPDKYERSAWETRISKALSSLHRMYTRTEILHSGVSLAGHANGLSQLVLWRRLTEENVMHGTKLLGYGTPAEIASARIILEGLAKVPSDRLGLVVADDESFFDKEKIGFKVPSQAEGARLAAVAIPAADDFFSLTPSGEKIRRDFLHDLFAANGPRPAADELDTLLKELTGPWAQRVASYDGGLDVLVADSAATWVTTFNELLEDVSKLIGLKVLPDIAMFAAMKDVDHIDGSEYHKESGRYIDDEILVKYLEHLIKAYRKDDASSVDLYVPRRYFGERGGKFTAPRNRLMARTIASMLKETLYPPEGFRVFEGDRSSRPVTREGLVNYLIEERGLPAQLLKDIWTEIIELTESNSWAEAGLSEPFGSPHPLNRIVFSPALFLKQFNSGKSGAAYGNLKRMREDLLLIEAAIAGTGENSGARLAEWKQVAELDNKFWMDDKSGEVRYDLLDPVLKAPESLRFAIARFSSADEQPEKEKVFREALKYIVQAHEQGRSVRLVWNSHTAADAKAFLSLAAESVPDWDKTDIIQLENFLESDGAAASDEKILDRLIRIRREWNAFIRTFNQDKNTVVALMDTDESVFLASLLGDAYGNPRKGDTRTIDLGIMRKAEALDFFRSGHRFIPMFAPILAAALPARPPQAPASKGATRKPAPSPQKKIQANAETAQSIREALRAVVRNGLEPSLKNVSQEAHVSPSTLSAYIGGFEDIKRMFDEAGAAWKEGKKDLAGTGEGVDVLAAERAQLWRAKHRTAVLRYFQTAGLNNTDADTVTKTLMNLDAKNAELLVRWGVLQPVQAEALKTIARSASIRSSDIEPVIQDGNLATKVRELISNIDAYDFAKIDSKLRLGMVKHLVPVPELDRLIRFSGLTRWTLFDDIRSDFTIIPSLPTNMDPKAASGARLAVHAAEPVILSQQELLDRLGQGKPLIEGLVAGDEELIFDTEWGRIELWRLNEIGNYTGWRGLFRLARDIHWAIEKGYLRMGSGDPEPDAAVLSQLASLQKGLTPQQLPWRLYYEGLSRLNAGSDRSSRIYARYAGVEGQIRLAVDMGYDDLSHLYAAFAGLPESQHWIPASLKISWLRRLNDEFREFQIVSEEPGRIGDALDYLELDAIDMRVLHVLVKENGWINDAALKGRILTIDPKLFAKGPDIRLNKAPIPDRPVVDRDTFQKFMNSGMSLIRDRIEGHRTRLDTDWGNVDVFDLNDRKNYRGREGFFELCRDLTAADQAGLLVFRFPATGFDQRWLSEMHRLDVQRLAWTDYFKVLGLIKKAPAGQYDGVDGQIRIAREAGIDNLEHLYFALGGGRNPYGWRRILITRPLYETLAGAIEADPGRYRLNSGLIRLARDYRGQGVTTMESVYSAFGGQKNIMGWTDIAGLSLEDYDRSERILKERPESFQGDFGQIQLAREAGVHNLEGFYHAFGGPANPYGWTVSIKLSIDDIDKIARYFEENPVYDFGPQDAADLLARFQIHPKRGAFLESMLGRDKDGRVFVDKEAFTSDRLPPIEPNRTYSYKTLLDALHRQAADPVAAEPLIPLGLSPALTTVATGFGGEKTDLTRLNRWKSEYKGRQGLIYLARDIELALQKGLLRMNLPNSVFNPRYLNELVRRGEGLASQQLHWKKYFAIKDELDRFPRVYRRVDGMMELSRKYEVSPSAVYSAFGDRAQQLEWKQVLLNSEKYFAIKRALKERERKSDFRGRKGLLSLSEQFSVSPRDVRSAFGDSHKSLLWPNIKATNAQIPVLRELMGKNPEKYHGEAGLVRLSIDGGFNSPQQVFTAFSESVQKKFGWTGVPVTVTALRRISEVLSEHPERFPISGGIKALWDNLSSADPSLSFGIKEKRFLSRVIVADPATRSFKLTSGLIDSSAGARLAKEGSATFRALEDAVTSHTVVLVDGTEVPTAIVRRFEIFNGNPVIKVVTRSENFADALANFRERAMRGYSPGSDRTAPESRVRVTYDESAGLEETIRPNSAVVGLHGSAGASLEAFLKSFMGRIESLRDAASKDNLNSEQKSVLYGLHAEWHAKIGRFLADKTLSRAQRDRFERIGVLIFASANETRRRGMWGRLNPVADKLGTAYKVLGDALRESSGARLADAGPVPQVPVEDVSALTTREWLDRLRPDLAGRKINIIDVGSGMQDERSISRGFVERMMGVSGVRERIGEVEAFDDIRLSAMIGAQPSESALVLRNVSRVLQDFGKQGRYDVLFVESPWAVSPLVEGVTMSVDHFAAQAGATVVVRFAFGKADTFIEELAKNGFVLTHEYAGLPKDYPASMSNADHLYVFTRSSGARLAESDSDPKILSAVAELEEQDIAITQQMIADLAGVDRITITRRMKENAVVNRAVKRATYLTDAGVNILRAIKEMRKEGITRGTGIQIAARAGVDRVSVSRMRDPLVRQDIDRFVYGARLADSTLDLKAFTTLTYFAGGEDVNAIKTLRTIFPSVSEVRVVDKYLTGGPFARADQFMSKASGMLGRRSQAFVSALNEKFPGSEEVSPRQFKVAAGPEKNIMTVRVEDTSISDFVPASQGASVYLIKTPGDNAYLSGYASFYGTVIAKMRPGDLMIITRSFLRRDVLDDPKSGLEKIDPKLVGQPEAKLGTKDWWRAFALALGDAAEFRNNEGALEHLGENLPFVEEGAVVYRRTAATDAEFIESARKEDRFEDKAKITVAPKGARLSDVSEPIRFIQFFNIAPLNVVMLMPMAEGAVPMMQPDGIAAMSAPEIDEMARGARLSHLGLDPKMLVAVDLESLRRDATEYARLMQMGQQALGSLGQSDVVLVRKLDKRISEDSHVGAILDSVRATMGRRVFFQFIDRETGRVLPGISDTVVPTKELGAKWVLLGEPGEAAEAAQNGWRFMPTEKPDPANGQAGLLPLGAVFMAGVVVGRADSIVDNDVATQFLRRITVSHLEAEQYLWYVYPRTGEEDFYSEFSIKNLTRIAIDQIVQGARMALQAVGGSA